MLDVIWEFRYVIVVIICGGIYSILEWNSTKKKIYKLMLKAKDLAKDKVLTSGESQLNYVSTVVYNLLPAYIRIFVTLDMMKKLVNSLYSEAMDFLDDGNFNKSYSYSDTAITEAEAYNSTEDTSEEATESEEDSEEEITEEVETVSLSE